MGGIGDRGDCAEHICNHSIDPIFIMQHVVIGEAQHMNSALAHVRIPRLVALRIHMRVAIDFDDELGVHTGEVSAIRSYGLLTAKVPALRPEVPENPPHRPFGAGLVKAQRAGTANAQRYPPPRPSPARGEETRLRGPWLPIHHLLFAERREDAEQGVADLELPGLGVDLVTGQIRHIKDVDGLFAIGADMG